MTRIGKIRICGFVDNLFWAVVWFYWFIPPRILGVVLAVLVILLLVVHIYERKWKIASDQVFQAVLVLFSWGLCFVLEKSVPAMLSFMAVLAIVILLLNLYEGVRRKKT